MLNKGEPPVKGKTPLYRNSWLFGNTEQLGLKAQNGSEQESSKVLARQLPETVPLRYGDPGIHVSPPALYSVK